MIGYVQGLQSVVDAVRNMTYSVIGSINFGSGGVANLVSGYVQQHVNPSYGSFWEFGILLAFFGFVLIGRGDRKPKAIQQELSSA